ncbi:hypothetical protein NLU13_8971 [Sarocladium strictum]|uniref:RBR-type E3 ubiquitin transferase n=1 Tax=Sarocladium strictum TaxID=5046 RepID=A0AA39G9B8_SARSR|nr:hypothetical protein NLU13_8971 [Sarocladium strictum]
MDFTDLELVDPETLLLIIQLQQDDAQALVQEAHPDTQEAQAQPLRFHEQVEVIDTNHTSATPGAEAITVEEVADTTDQSSEPANLDDELEASQPELSAAKTPSVGDTTASAPPEDIDEEDAVSESDSLPDLELIFPFVIDESGSSDDISERGQFSSDETGAQKRTRITCISCTTTTCKANTLQFPCSHFYCLDCVVDLHRAATTDESLFPPRCCAQVLPYDLARPILSEDEAEKYELKAIEYRTKDKTYCHQQTCSKFIPPRDIDGLKARCGECRAKTCTLCKQAFHEGACPADDQTADVLHYIDAQGWKCCPGCKNAIELNTGCNHMTNILLACLCKAEFCYECGKTWKTCACAQWDEGRLLDRVANVVDLNVPVGVDPAAHARTVARVRQDVINNHHCTRHRWEKRYGRHRCEECRFKLPEYIFLCTSCGIQSCWRCRLNRL